MKKQKKCIFCGVDLTPANKSNEHIFPRWLLRDLKVTKTRVTIETSRADVGEIPEDKRSFYIDGFVLGHVCRKRCNEGWMAKLEAEALEVINPLAVGEKSLDQLTLKGRIILSRWAIKTAYTLNASSGKAKIDIPEEHHRFLMDHPSDIYGGVEVFAHQEFQFIPYLDHPKGRPFHWIISPQFTFLDSIDKDKRDFLKANSYKVTFLLGILVLTIFYCADKKMASAPMRYYHWPIWPLVVRTRMYEGSFPEKTFNYFRDYLKEYHDLLAIRPLSDKITFRVFPDEDADFFDSYFKPTH